MSDELDILRASLLSGKLHITRASQWTDADRYPITRAEWESFAEVHPKLSQHGAFSCKGGAKVRLSWADDHVKAWGELLGNEAALATLAAQIRARLLTDDEDEYLPDESRVHWDESRKPITP